MWNNRVHARIRIVGLEITVFLVVDRWHNVEMEREREMCHILDIIINYVSA